MEAFEIEWGADGRGSAPGHLGCFEYQRDGATVHLRHTPHGPSTDDLMPGWQALSTSARLRETQAALAASQDDLTRALAECDELRAQNDLHGRQLAEAATVIHKLKDTLADACAENGHQRELLDLVIADRARLRAALSELQHALPVWVARSDLDAPCPLCGQPIVRGQAVEVVPGWPEKDQQAHAACPDLTPIEERP